MDAQAVERRLRLGEDSATEFKSVVRRDYTLDPGDFAKAVSCLANSGGGVVLVGVEKDGTVSGVGTPVEADALMRQASQAAAKGIQPPLSCRYTFVEVGSVPVLVVEVPAFSPERPHLVDGRVYVRDGNLCRPATRNEQIRLLESADHHFDEQPVSGAARDDLDDVPVRAFLERSYTEEFDERKVGLYLRQLKCLDDDGTPSVAGILLFGRTPERWLPEARVSAVRIPGTEPGLDFADRAEIGGRLLDQVDGARAFLDRHLQRPSTVAGWQRISTGVPESVLREAVLNALAHRDYRMSAQVRLLLFEDRLEIVNPGGLLNRLTLENIRRGITQRRNPVIASLLARAHSRENVGLGIPTMFQLMREQGLPEPEMSVEGGHFRVVLRLLPSP